MSNYEKSAYSLSSSSGGTATGAGGFDVSKAIFNQVDSNRDGSIDRNEFQQWISSNSGGGAISSSAAGASGIVGASGVGGGYESGSYQSSSYSSGEVNGGNFGIDLGLSGVAGLAGGAVSYDSTDFSSASAVDAGAAGGNSAQISFGSTGAGADAGYDTVAVNQAVSYTADTNPAWSQYGAEVRGVGLYVDANPQIIRRPATGVQTYTQNIQIRFLQPPPVPPPGPLIIKEVRPPQPPPPPPLRIKQHAPPLPQPPPLILRERPPPPPPSQASETVVRNLPALPVPPRSVIIERIPAAPARPRDIIIERWIPYGAAAKRKTIVQRAESAKDYPKPRNIIIQYDAIQVRVVRQFQRLGVVQENPQSYVQRYGAQLLDAQTLLQQARAAGVIEDISPPAGLSGFGVSQDSSVNVRGSASGAEFSGVVGGDFGASGGFSSSTFEGGYVGAGISAAAGAGSGDSFASSAYESTAFSSGTGGASGGYVIDGGFGTGLDGGYSSSSYEAAGYTSSGVNGLDVATATFNSLDKNKDGTIDRNEFKQFFQGGL